MIAYALVITEYVDLGVLFLKCWLGEISLRLVGFGVLIRLWSDVGPTLDFGLWTVGFGLWTLEIWTVDFGLWFDFGSSPLPPHPPSTYVTKTNSPGKGPVRSSHQTQNWRL